MTPVPNSASTTPNQWIWFDLPEVPNADVTGVGFSRDESLMAFYASSSQSPANLFVQQVDGGQPRQLTNSLSAEIQVDDLVDAEVVRFESYDGVEIPGVLYRPLRPPPTPRCQRWSGCTVGPGSVPGRIQPVDSVSDKPWIRRLRDQQPR